MPKIQKYGIKFPLSIASGQRTLLDLDMSRAEKVRSELMHLIFTPRGQRLREPTFGSRLIQYIFNPNDGDTWGDVVTEIKEMVSTWVPDCSVQDISLENTDDGRGIVAHMKYTVSEIDGTVSTYNLDTTV